MRLSVPMADADGAPPQSLSAACVCYGYQPEEGLSAIFMSASASLIGEADGLHPHRVAA